MDFIVVDSFASAKEANSPGNLISPFSASLRFSYKFRLPISGKQDVDAAIFLSLIPDLLKNLP